MVKVRKVKQEEKYLASHLYGTFPKFFFAPFSFIRVIKNTILNSRENLRRLLSTLIHIYRNGDKKFTLTNFFDTYRSKSLNDIKNKWNLTMQNSVTLNTVRPYEYAVSGSDARIAIVIFGFNRPKKLALLLKSLLQHIDDSKFDFFAFIDGPRTRQEEVKTNQSVRIAKELLPLGSRVIENPINLGLRSSVIFAGNKVFKNYDQCIFLEDDLLIEPGFIDFIVNNLRKYANDSRVLGISGHQPIKLHSANSYRAKMNEVFLKRPHSWGWATWKDRWIEVDWSDDFLRQAALSKSIRKSLTSMGLDLVPMLRSQLQGQINSWAITFCVHASITQQRTVYPLVSLTKNIGLGEDSTHTGDFLRKQPTLLVSMCEAVGKFSNRRTLNMLLEVIFFRYYSLLPTKVVEKA